MLPFKKILWPTDFSEPSMYSLGTAVDTAKRDGAELYLIHVVSPVPPVTPAATLAPEATMTSAFDVDAYNQQQKQSAKEQLEKIKTEHIPPEVETDSLVVEGKDADEILSTAEDKGVDLIVISTTGSRGFSRIIFGSVTDKIVRNSCCPVLSIPGPNDEG